MEQWHFFSVMFINLYEVTQTDETQRSLRCAEVLAEWKEEKKGETQMIFKAVCDVCTWVSRDAANLLEVRDYAKKHLNQTEHPITIKKDGEAHSTIRKIQSLGEIRKTQ